VRFVDNRRDYGEQRVVAIGLAQGIALTVVFTDRTETGAIVRRIISARLSNRRERQAYFEALSQERKASSRQGETCQPSQGHRAIDRADLAA
jgi:hypothetical protein